MHLNDYYNKNLKQFARKLRKNSTLAEVILWNEVLKNRKLGYKFLRQRPVIDYIGDFFCKDLKLFIELDGATHFEESVIVKDRKKQLEIKTHGYSVLRFKDEQVVEELEKVKGEIELWIKGYEEKYPEVLEMKVRKNKVKDLSPPKPPSRGEFYGL